MSNPPSRRSSGGKLERMGSLNTRHKSWLKDVEHTRRSMHNLVAQSPRGSTQGKPIPLRETPSTQNLRFLYAKGHEPLNVWSFELLAAKVRKSERPHVVLVGKGLTLTANAVVLEKMGMRVDCLSDGRSAFQVWSTLNTSINLLVVDKDVPGMGGIELVKYIRQTEEEQNRTRAKRYQLHTPIVVLIGRNDDIQECLDSGFDHFLRKPLTLHLKALRFLLFPYAKAKGGVIASEANYDSVRRLLEELANPDVCDDEVLAPSEETISALQAAADDTWFRTSRAPTMGRLGTLSAAEGDEAEETVEKVHFGVSPIVGPSDAPEGPLNIPDTQSLRPSIAETVSRKSSEREGEVVLLGRESMIHTAPSTDDDFLRPSIEYLQKRVAQLQRENTALLMFQEKFSKRAEHVDQMNDELVTLRQELSTLQHLIQNKNDKLAQVYSHIAVERVRLQKARDGLDVHEELELTKLELEEARNDNAALIKEMNTIASREQRTTESLVAQLNKVLNDNDIQKERRGFEEKVMYFTDQLRKEKAEQIAQMREKKLYQKYLRMACSRLVKLRQVVRAMERTMMEHEELTSRSSKTFDTLSETPDEPPVFSNEDTKSFARLRELCNPKRLNAEHQWLERLAETFIRCCTTFRVNMTTALKKQQDIVGLLTKTPQTNKFKGMSERLAAGSARGLQELFNVEGRVLCDLVAKHLEGSQKEAAPPPSPLVQTGAVKIMEALHRNYATKFQMPTSDKAVSTNDGEWIELLKIHSGKAGDKPSMLLRALGLGVSLYDFPAGGHQVTLYPARHPMYRLIPDDEMRTMLQKIKAYDAREHRTSDIRRRSSLTSRRRGARNTKVRRTTAGSETTQTSIPVSPQPSQPHLAPHIPYQHQPPHPLPQQQQQQQQQQSHVQQPHLSLEDIMGPKERTPSSPFTLLSHPDFDSPCKPPSIPHTPRQTSGQVEAEAPPASDVQSPSNVASPTTPARSATQLPEAPSATTPTLPSSPQPSFGQPSSPRPPNVPSRSPPRQSRIPLKTRSSQMVSRRNPTQQSPTIPTTHTPTTSQLPLSPTSPGPPAADSPVRRKAKDRLHRKKEDALQRIGRLQVHGLTEADATVTCVTEKERQEALMSIEAEIAEIEKVAEVLTPRCPTEGFEPVETRIPQGLHKKFQELERNKKALESPDLTVDTSLMVLRRLVGTLNESIATVGDEDVPLSQESTPVDNRSDESGGDEEPPPFCFPQQGKLSLSLGTSPFDVVTDDEGSDSRSRPGTAPLWDDPRRRAPQKVDASTSPISFIEPVTPTTEHPTRADAATSPTLPGRTAFGVSSPPGEWQERELHHTRKGYMGMRKDLMVLLQMCRVHIPKLGGAGETTEPPGTASLPEVIAHDWGYVNTYANYLVSDRTLQAMQSRALFKRLAWRVRLQKLESSEGPPEKVEEARKQINMWQMRKDLMHSARGNMQDQLQLRFPVPGNVDMKHSNTEMKASRVVSSLTNQTGETGHTSRSSQGRLQQPLTSESCTDVLPLARDTIRLVLEGETPSYTTLGSLAMKSLSDVLSTPTFSQVGDVDKWFEEVKVVSKQVVKTAPQKRNVHGEASGKGRRNQPSRKPAEPAQSEGLEGEGCMTVTSFGVSPQNAVLPVREPPSQPVIPSPASPQSPQPPALSVTVSSGSSSRRPPSRKTAATQLAQHQKALREASSERQRVAAELEVAELVKQMIHKETGIKGAAQPRPARKPAAPPPPPPPVPLPPPQSFTKFPTPPVVAAEPPAIISRPSTVPSRPAAMLVQPPPPPAPPKWSWRELLEATDLSTLVRYIENGDGSECMDPRLKAMVHVLSSVCPSCARNKGLRIESQRTAKAGTPPTVSRGARIAELVAREQAATRRADVIRERYLEALQTLDVEWRTRFDDLRRAIESGNVAKPPKPLTCLERLIRKAEMATGECAPLHPMYAEGIWLIPESSPTITSAVVAALCVVGLSLPPPVLPALLSGMVAALEAQLQREREKDEVPLPPDRPKAKAQRRPRKGASACTFDAAELDQQQKHLHDLLVRHPHLASSQPKIAGGSKKEASAAARRMPAAQPALPTLQ